MNQNNNNYLEMKFKCRFCGARFEYETNIRSHADMYHAEIVEQLMYRQYVEYLESQQRESSDSSSSSASSLASFIWFWADATKAQWFEINIE